MKQIEEERKAMMELERRERAEREREMIERRERERIEREREREIQPIVIRDKERDTGGSVYQKDRRCYYGDKKTRKSCEIKKPKAVRYEDKREFRRSYNPNLKHKENTYSRERNVSNEKLLSNRENITIKRKYVNLGIGEQRNDSVVREPRASQRPYTMEENKKVKRVEVKVDLNKADNLIGDLNDHNTRTNCSNNTIKKPTLAVLIQNHRRKTEQRTRSRGDKRKEAKIVIKPDSDINDLAASPREYGVNVEPDWRGLGGRTLSRPNTGISTSPGWVNSANTNTINNFNNERSPSYRFQNERSYSRKLATQRENPFPQNHQNMGNYRDYQIRNDNSRFGSPQIQKNLQVTSPRAYNYDNHEPVTSNPANNYSPFNPQKIYPDQSTFSQRNPF